MQPADHVHFSDSKGQRVPDRADNFVDRILEGMRVTFFCGESTKLTRKDANVGVIDVTIVDIGREVAVFSLTQNVGDYSQCVQVARAIERERIGLRDSLTSFNFFGDWPKFF